MSTMAGGGTTSARFTTTTIARKSLGFFLVLLLLFFVLFETGSSFTMRTNVRMPCRSSRIRGTTATRNHLPGALLRSSAGDNDGGGTATGPKAAVGPKAAGRRRSSDRRRGKRGGDPITEASVASSSIAVETPAAASSVHHAAVSIDEDQLSTEATEEATESSIEEALPPPPVVVVEPIRDDERPRFLDDKQLDFVMGYLNKHHTSLLTKLAESFSELGVEKSKQNAWSGGSFQILSAKITGIDTDRMELDVDVRQRREGLHTRRVTIELDAVPLVKKRRFGTGSEIPPPVARNLNLLPIDDVLRRLIRLCWMVDDEARTTGKLFQLGMQLGGTEAGRIKDNMYLNQCPHNRYVRRYFYDMAAEAVLEAVVLCAQGRISNRMKVKAMFPEMNPSMDSYRIGTILEMVRAMTIKLVEQNLRVRVCVQGSMGVGIFTGVPKQLGGVSKLLQMMDWQSEQGEENEGMVGNYLNFGHIGAQHVVNAHVREDGTRVEQDDVFILIAPQSMVGVDSSIIGPLKEMVEAAGDRPVILLNPDLTDKVSSQGQQNVRGRQDRIDFANSFKTIWHFQNIYVSGTSYFPILGASFKPGPLSMWSSYQRRDLANNDGEVYLPVLAGEDKPKGEQILENFEN